MSYNWYFIVYFGNVHLSMTLCFTKQLECFYLLLQILGRIMVINEPRKGMINASTASRCTADPFVQIKPFLKVLTFFRATSLLPCHNSHYKSLKLSLPFLNVILTKGLISPYIFPSKLHWASNTVSSKWMGNVWSTETSLVKRRRQKAGLPMISASPEILHMHGDGLCLTTPLFAKAAS